MASSAQSPPQPSASTTSTTAAAAGSSPPSTSSPIFSLANRSLKLDTAADIESHIQPLLESPETITEIRLNGNTIGVPAAERLARVLPTLTNLHTANMADIFTGRLLAEIPPALDALLTALLECKQLETVDLSDNAFGLNTVEPLVAFSRQHIPLRHFILNNNGLGPFAGTRIADALTELAEKKKEKGNVQMIETVVCGRNRLEAGSMAAWSKALAAHASGLKVVRMVQNGIRPEGIRPLLTDGLSKCASLEVVDLQDNTFTISGGLALGNAVGGWKELRELGIGDSLVGAKGAVNLAEALAKGGNEKLAVLRAQYNEIDEKGLKALVEAIERGGLPGLRRVELNGNKFSEDHESVMRLREILEERREKAEKAGGGEAADGVEGAWGVDDLSDMEEDSDEEDEDEEDEDGEDGDEDEKEAEAEKEGKANKILEEADQEENQTVAQRKDKDVDDLADELGKTL